ncbi:Hypothetical predicted protein [Xyrichtys novacula]|uniref:Uncharacterized protein n=1 Tax=Xyrichtys novacula TaxID=13765 RepID=A0AAV1GAB9_XYRNO|nr:Hypothetical predicted protein [Xyrichtys novacula]
MWRRACHWFGAEEWAGCCVERESTTHCRRSRWTSVLKDSSKWPSPRLLLRRVGATPTPPSRPRGTRCRRTWTSVLKDSSKWSCPRLVLRRVMVAPMPLSKPCGVREMQHSLVGSSPRLLLRMDGPPGVSSPEHNQVPYSLPFSPSLFSPLPPLLSPIASPPFFPSLSFSSSSSSSPPVSPPVPPPVSSSGSCSFRSRGSHTRRPSLCSSPSRSQRSPAGPSHSSPPCLPSLLTEEDQWPGLQPEDPEELSRRKERWTAPLRTPTPPPSTIPPSNRLISTAPDTKWKRKLKALLKLRCRGSKWISQSKRERTSIKKKPPEEPSRRLKTQED